MRRRIVMVAMVGAVIGRLIYEVGKWEQQSCAAGKVGS